MCLLLLAFQVHPAYPVVLAANRDEYYERPTAPADWWADRPDVLGGRDLVSGGTWLAVTRSGRFAAVTNYRDPARPPGTESRGNLVPGALTGNVPDGDYSGYNLLSGDRDHLDYATNVNGRRCGLPPGVYGLSNGLLDSPWPKVRLGKQRLAGRLQLDPESLLDVLSDSAPAPDSELPDTGVGLEAERALSPIFVRTPTYGTRCSSVLRIDRKGWVDFLERTFPCQGGLGPPPSHPRPGGELRRFRFRIGAYDPDQ
ncbi:MAG: NRDE family protein [Candidatus Eremiobacterota bacterium]